MMPDSSDRPSREAPGRTWVSVADRVGHHRRHPRGRRRRRHGLLLLPPHQRAVHAARERRQQFARGARAVRRTEAAHRDPERRRTDPPPRSAIQARGVAAAKLDTLRVLAYDTHARKARARLDSVLAAADGARRQDSSRFSTTTGIDFDTDRVHLTLEDLERRGPGLILDQEDRRGSQVLVWTE